MVIVLSSTMVMNTNRNSYKLESPTDKGYNNGGNYYHHQQPQYHHQAGAMNYNNWYADTSTHQQINATQLNLPYEETSNNLAKEEATASSCNCFSLSDCNLPSSCCSGGAGESSAVNADPANTYNNDHNRSSSNVLASYGVYGSQHHQPDDDDDDDGFVPRGSGTYSYHHSVVNVTGNTTSTNILRNAPGAEGYLDASGVDGGARTYSGRCCCFSRFCDDDGSTGCCGASGLDTARPPQIESNVTTTDSCCTSWCRPTILLLLLVLLVVVFVLISGILLYFNCKFN
ncbi:uncharacterized protein [Anabrus simplex]|uniref:uncharacterized protein n=1 Tax=Anabrus simplex TaxID=316456 RepID=UPI0034DD7E7D